MPSLDDAANQANQIAMASAFTPNWSINDSSSNLRETLWGFDPDATVSAEGNEFTIGFVRGSMRGGDWGVSYVQKRFDDGSQFHEFEESDPCTPEQCSRRTSTVVLQDVQLQGVEFHWNRPLFTIANRVQIGFNVAGGVASVKGNAEETMVFEDSFAFPGIPPQQNVFVDTYAGPIDDFAVMYSVLPLLKIEAQAAVLVAPGLKVKVAGGLNMPALSVRVGATYLFGAR